MFSQSACILLNETIPTEQILAVLHEHDLPVILHKQGNDILTRASACDVCEVVLRTEQPASILVDCQDHPWPDAIPKDREDPVTYLSWHAGAFACSMWPRLGRVFWR